MPVHSRSPWNVVCLSQAAVAISNSAVVPSIVLSQVIGIVVVVDDVEQSRIDWILLRVQGRFRLK